ncbi:MAG: hypothetical protein M3P43_08490 [Actinomycetota bacterium]|nr:hypothetical protein [Actinomycetota bacterium]
MQPLRPTAGEAASLRIAEELDGIEAAVLTGSTDLRALGFWRVVAAIKRDPVLVLDHADQVGRIDQAAFRARVRARVPVWVGALLLGGVIAVGVIAIVLAARWTGTAAGLALVAAAVSWSIGVHSPTHMAFGWFAGIRFTDYFLGGPPPPRPGLKTDYATYLRAEPSMRAWFHASGAIATKIAPFVAVALAPATNAPAWAVIAAAAIGVLQIATDVLFSTKSSDWKKFRRERAVTKDLRRR